MSAAPVLSPARAAHEAATPHGVLASFGRFTPPFEIDRFGGAFGAEAPVRASGILHFRFCFHEVPFEGLTARRNGRPVLTLTGDLGLLPFTVESPTRRRRLRKLLEAAQRGSGLTWEITPQQHMRLTGEIDLGLPLTLTAVIAGATRLLLTCRPYLDLVVAVAGEA